MLTGSSATSAGRCTVPSYPQLGHCRVAGEQVREIRDSFVRSVQAVMVEKPKDGNVGKASAMDTMGYNPSGMPAGMTL